MSPDLKVDLRHFIRDIPDFPQPGVLFRDITPLLGDASAFRSVVEGLSERLDARPVDTIVGIESRGFLFGAPLAYIRHIPFVPIRKAGKLPAPVMSVEYALEYGSSQLDIHKDAVAPGKSVAVVDDVLATGGTALAAVRLIEMLGAKVAACLFLAELEFLGGRGRLDGYEVISLLRY
jgi:adenine phosphoribosyltransferase